MSLFSVQERSIYPCPVTDRAFDPLGVKRALTVATGNRFGALCGEARGEDAVKAAQAQITLTLAARKAFGFEPLVVTDAQVWEALIKFTQWLTGKGQRAKPQPQASPSSDGRGNPTTTPGSG